MVHSVGSSAREAVSVSFVPVTHISCRIRSKKPGPRKRKSVSRVTEYVVRFTYKIVQALVYEKVTKKEN